MPERLMGRQTPRFAIVPRAQYSDGPECGELAAAYGLKPDPWQQLVLDGWLSCNKDGMYVAGTCGCSVPRQNGKNGLLEMVELFKSAVQGRCILHTAHEVKTARKAFLRIRGFFENERDYPELAEMVSYIRSTNGQEAIVLKNGGSIEFIARSKSSGRGFTVDDVVCDEVQELTDEQLEVLRPTMSSCKSGNPQMFMVGTPTPPGSPGTVFQRTRKKAISGADKRIAWFEWSVDKIGDVRDRQRWADTNPSLGGRLLEKVVEDELATMSDDGFARERLGWWADSSSKQVISRDLWESLAVEEAPDHGKRAFGIKFTQDGTRVVVAGCVRPGDEEPYCEVIFDRKVAGGIGWLADWLNEKKRRATTAITVIDGLSMAGALIERLGQIGYPAKMWERVNSTNVVSADSMVLNAINEGDFTHGGQPGLDASAVNAERREIGKGGGWGWGGPDPTPMEAVSLAYWGAATTRRHPGRGSRVL